MTHTRESLIAFRDKVSQAFREKRIRSPVHFPGGNEDQLIHIFEGVKPHDWVFCSWRNMYHALLKGIPEDELFEAILDGRSMYLWDVARRFGCSSIVGGILPIAVGAAMGLKFSKAPGTVWAFVGDMTATTGLYHEAVRYAMGHCLPMRFVVEDNGLSTNARTRSTWRSFEPGPAVLVDGYTYERTMPHVGLAERVSF